MGRDNKVTSLYYIDAILHENIPPEEREKQLAELKAESDKLTEWPET